MYHLARSCAFIENHPNRKEVKIFRFPDLTDEDQDPYFIPDTPQYHWRMLYNSFCDKLDEFDGLRETLKREDGRFVNWSESDEEPVKEYSFPDTRPTIPTFAIPAFLPLHNGKPQVI